MTTIELTFAFFHVCIVVAAVWAGFAMFGIVGGAVGAMVGVASLLLFYRGIGTALSLWHERHPLRPVCKNGVCRADDYELVEAQRDFLAFRCRCGIRYIHKQRQFLEILPDGTPKRFMRKKAGFGGWEPDDT